MPEGSVFVDGFDDGSDDATSEDSIDETSTDEVVEDSKEEPEVKSEADDKQEDESDDSDEGEPKLTPKGTKVDPNPASAVHQELANERRQRLQMEEILNDPDKLNRYMSAAGFNKSTVEVAKDKPKPTSTDELQELIKPERLQTVGDYSKALQALASYTQNTVESYETKIGGLTKELGGLSAGRRLESVANTIDKDITLVREKYPELDPKSSDFNPELEKEIGELFNELDFDGQSMTYRGSHSLLNIAERMMRSAVALKKAGSSEAQKIVKEKRMGRVSSTGKSKAEATEENLSPGQVIAQRIARMSRR